MTISATEARKARNRRYYLKIVRPRRARRRFIRLVKSLCDFPDAVLHYRDFDNGWTPYDEEGWWSVSNDIPRLRAYFSDCCARRHLCRSSLRCDSGRLDFEFLNHRSATELPVPRELRITSRKYDPSTIKEPDCLQVESGQWVCLGALYRLSSLAVDRWFYGCQHQKHFAIHPGEWMVIYRHELPQVFPCKGMTDRTMVDRSRHLMHVVRDPVTRHPTQLRVYSPTYKPEFTVTLNFREPFTTPDPSVRSEWWDDKHLMSSAYRRRQEQQASRDLEDVA